MALLYPNLSAAVADIAHPNWRGSAIGIYRFWRDLGYGIGALLLGAVAALAGGIEAGFWFIAVAMFVSGLRRPAGVRRNAPAPQPGNELTLNRRVRRAHAVFQRMVRTAHPTTRKEPS